MAVDNRDYYVERVRKRSRYVERSSFRMSEAEKARMKRRRMWLRLLFLVLFAAAVLAALRYIKTG